MDACIQVDRHLRIWIYPWISTWNPFVWIWVWMRNFVSTYSVRLASVAASSWVNYRLIFHSIHHTQRAISKCSLSIGVQYGMQTVDSKIHFTGEAPWTHTRSNPGNAPALLHCWSVALWTCSTDRQYRPTATAQSIYLLLPLKPTRLAELLTLPMLTAALQEEGQG